MIKPVDAAENKSMREEKSSRTRVVDLSLTIINAHRAKILGLTGLFFLLLPIHLFNILFCWILITQITRSEDNYRTDELFCSLPVKRPVIVTARFLVSLVIVLAATVLGFIVFHTALLFTDFYPRFLEIKPGVFIFLFPIILLISAYFPLYFRNGHRPGVEVSFTLAFITAALWLGMLYIVVSVVSGSWQLPSEAGVKLVLVSQALAVINKSIAVFGLRVFHLVLLLTMVLLLLLSFTLSLGFYSRREF